MKSKLYLETEFSHNQTNIKTVEFSAPYKIMSPLKDGTHSDIMLMSASAGLLAGDSLTSEFVFNEQCDVNFISQSYEKVFCTEDRNVKKDTLITVQENAIAK